MNKSKKLYEGKAKIIYATADKNLVIQYFKDDATAFNNQKKSVIEGKGVLNNRISAIMFLTDGIPSSHLLPPRGIINTLERKIANYNEKNLVIPNFYTYGFGYSLDTELLVNIAKIGNGNFSFIPDSGFVGTVLINSLSYIKTTINRDICLNFENTCNNFLVNAKSYNMSLVNKKNLIKHNKI